MSTPNNNEYVDLKTRIEKLSLESIQIGHVVGIFPLEWFQQWQSNISVGNDSISFGKIISQKSPKCFLNPLYLNQDVVVLSQVDTDLVLSIFETQNSEDRNFQFDDFRDCLNVGIVFTKNIPNTEKPNIHDFIDFQMFGLPVNIYDSLSAKLLTVVSKLPLGTIATLAMKAFEIEVPTFYSVRVKFICDGSTHTMRLCGRESIPIGPLSFQEIIVERLECNEDGDFKEILREKIASWLAENHQRGIKVPEWYLDHCHDFVQRRCDRMEASPPNLNWLGEGSQMSESLWTLLQNEKPADLALQMEDLSVSKAGHEALPKKLKIIFQGFGTFYCPPTSRLSGVKDEFSCRAWDGTGKEPVLYRLFPGRAELYDDRLDDLLSALPNPSNMEFKLSMDEASTSETDISVPLPANTNASNTGVPTIPVPATQTNDAQLCEAAQGHGIETEPQYVTITLKNFGDKKFLKTDTLADVYQTLLEMTADNSEDVPMLVRFLKSPSGADIFRNHMDRLKLPIGKLRALDNLVFTLQSESVQNPTQSVTSDPIMANEPKQEDPNIPAALREFRNKILQYYYNEYIPDSSRGPFDMMVNLADTTKNDIYISRAFRAIVQCLLRMKPVGALFHSHSRFIKAIYLCDSPAHINDQWLDSNAQQFLYWLLHAWGFMRIGSHQLYDIGELRFAFQQMNPEMNELRSDENAVLRLFCAFIQQIHDVTELPNQSNGVKCSDFTDGLTISMNVSKTCSMCGFVTESIDSKRFLNIPLKKGRSLQVLMIPQCPWTKGGSAVNAPTKMDLSLSEHASIHDVIEMLQPNMPHIPCNEWNCYTRHKDSTIMRIIPKDRKISQLDRNITELYLYEHNDDPIEFVHLTQSNLSFDEILPISPFLVKSSLFHYQKDAKNVLLGHSDFKQYLEMIFRFMSVKYNQSIREAVKEIRQGDGQKILPLKMKSFNHVMFDKEFWLCPDGLVNDRKSLSNVEKAKNWFLKALWYSGSSPNLNQLLLNVIRFSDRSDNSDVFHCEKCRQTRECVLRSNIIHSPKLFVIHLQRWKAHGDRFKRINADVECPKEMDLSAMMTNATDRNQYQLVAIVNDSVSNSFAQCLRRREYGKSDWITFESGIPDIITSPKMKDATLLFYERMMTHDVDSLD